MAGLVPLSGSMGDVQIHRDYYLATNDSVVRSWRGQKQYANAVFVDLPIGYSSANQKKDKVQMTLPKD